MSAVLNKQFVSMTHCVRRAKDSTPYPKGLIQRHRVDIYLEDTAEENIDFVIEFEREEESKLYAGQWNKEQHLASISDKDIKT